MPTMTKAGIDLRNKLIQHTTETGEFDFIAVLSKTAKGRDEINTFCELVASASAIITAADPHEAAAAIIEEQKWGSKPLHTCQCGATFADKTEFQIHQSEENWERNRHTPAFLLID